MSDDATPRLALPFLAAGQAQKEMTHNEALQRLDALVQPVVLSADLTAPPASPGQGDSWIVAAGATGAWVGQDGCIAQWTAGGWRFMAPTTGWRVLVLDRSGEMIRSAGVWKNGAIRQDGVYIGEDKVVGARMSGIAAPTGGSMIDSEARAAINALLTAMRSHGLISS